MKKINNWGFEPVNKSWLIGFIKTTFNVPLVDFYINQFITSDGTIIADLTALDSNVQHIIYVDDENFVNDIPQLKTLLLPLQKNGCFIVKIKEIYKQLTDHNFKCVWFPYYHIVDEFFPLRHLNTVPFNKSLVPYASLNRRWTKDREDLINTLLEYEIVDKGYVTVNFDLIDNIFDKEAINKFKKDDLSHYIDSHESLTIGFERIQHTLESIPISSNLKNCYHIAENIPGNILIHVETDFLTEQPTRFPTEKSFLAFATFRIPMVFASWDVMKDLKDEGFDIFDDLIEQSLDIKTAIKQNIKILSNPFNYDIKDRLIKNYNYFINDWIDKKLHELVDSISKILALPE